MVFARPAFKESKEKLQLRLAQAKEADHLAGAVNRHRPGSVMYRDAITILLIARTEQHKGIGSFESYVANADALYAELLAKGAKILGSPVSRPWGLRDFRVIDLEGNRITFAQTFE